MQIKGPFRTATLRYGILILLLLTGLACQTLMPSNAPPTTTPTSREMTDRHQTIFQFVWSTVKKNYVYDDYNGADWDAVKTEFAPRVAAAPDDEAFWRLMQELIGRLNDQHSTYLTPQQVADEDQAMSGELDYVGIGIFVNVPKDADYGVILLPIPGSPAEAAGVRPHDRLLAINGQPACCTPDGFDNLYLLEGKEGTSVRITLQQPGAPERELDVLRARIQAQVPVISRRIATDTQDVGYLLIPTLWDETIAERTRQALEALIAGGPLQGLIVDMRINGGGAYTELYDLLALFTSGEVGNFQRRGSKKEPLVIAANPVDDSQHIPLVILVGRDTESYAEIFGGVLQDLGRARLVGRPTAGNVETVYPYDLEDSSRLWLAEETFVPPGGTRWEGRGVQPDVGVDGEWEDFTEEDDAQLKAALDIITGK